jgi:TP901 family phage tail tape measure protein
MFMADINANFEYDADFGPAIAQVRSLAREISLLNNSFNSLDKAALTAKKQLATSFGTNVKSLGAFQTTMVDLSSDVDRFGEALQKNKLHMRDYFKEARRAYTEGSRVRKLAVEQVRKAQSEIVSLGKDATGRNKGMVITPLSVDTKNMTTSMKIAREQFTIFNKLVQDGSRELINWGKNTQWAGRQLTVGLTVPLTILGASLSKTFRDFDKELTRFQKVYGSDVVNTTANASQEMRKQVELLAKDIAGKFGIAVSQTAALAADLAATGLEGQKLTSSIQQTTRLSVLGEVDRQEAMKATLALQNAFNMSTTELAESINFLNAVENQTSVSIQDLTEAIPRTGPVIKAMGGDVKDLSVLLVAMKEGGINAAEGANAIKSGMASLINPTKQAAATAKGFGIDLEGIVTRNKGKLMPTILEFQQAMMGLDEFSRAQIIEQVFGKYQFARIAALFDNLNAAGSQTVEVIKLMSASSTDLANVANAELRTLTESTSMRFTRAMESIKASLLPIGEALTRSVIPFLEKAANLFNKLVEFGSNLPEPVKNFIKLATGITAIAGPIVMITGVLANFLGYVTKGAMGIVNLGRAVMGIPTKQFELLNTEQIVALKSTDLLTSAYNRQDQSLSKLTSTMNSYVAALRNQAATNPGQFVPGSQAKPTKKANGGKIPGTGSTDSVPALLMPGEFVMNKEATEKYGPIINAMNQGKIKGFAKGSQTINVGGQDIDFSMLKQQTFDKLLRSLEGRLEKFSDVVKRAAVDLENARPANGKVPAEEARKIINQSAIDLEREELLSNKETKYNANSAGETRRLAVQLREERPTEAQNELRQAAAAARAVREQNLKDMGITEQELLLEENAQKKKLLDSRVQLDRAHIVSVNKATKDRENWSSDLWTTQTGVENVFSEMMKRSDKNQAEYLKVLAEVEPDVAVRAKMEQKITSGIALTEKELQVQRRVLERMVAQSASYGKGALSPQFMSTAPSVIAAARGRASSGIVVPDRNQNLAEIKAATIAGRNIGDAATKGAATGAGTQSPSKKTKKVGKDIAQGLIVGMNEDADDVARAGQNLTTSAITGTQRGTTGLQRGRQRAASMGKSILQRGASMSGGAMGAAFALNSIGAMNQGFANATAGLTKFTNGLFLATTAMQLMQGGVGGLGSAGGKLKNAGSATFVKGARMSIAAKAAGGASKTGSLLMMGGRALSLLGGPVGFAAIAAITAVTAGIIAYKKAIGEARKAGEAMYASQTAAAEYYGITLKSVNDQMKANAETSKNLGLAPSVSAQGVDPALKKAILDQEENKKLVEQLKSSSDPASLLLGQYGKMLQQGFSPAQAKEVLAVLSQASSQMGALTKLSGTLSGITTTSQATAAVGQSFSGSLSGIMGAQTKTAYGRGGAFQVTDKSFGATDKARLEGAFSGVISSALLSPDLGEGLAVLKKSITAAFAEGAKNGVNAKEVGEALNKSITTQLTEMGFKEGDPILEAVNNLGTSASDLEDKMILVQAAAAGIDMSRFLADGKASKEELKQIRSQLALIDTAAQIDLQIGVQLDQEIQQLNELKESETARYDNLISKNEEAKVAEEERHKNFTKNIDKKNKALEKEIKKIKEGADEYIKALDKENKADSFRRNQRQSAIGGLESLASGDVFGFLQAQQEMAANAADYGRNTEIDRIKETADAAEEKLQDQIDINKELADGEDERHDARMSQLDKENQKIQRNKSSLLQSVDAAIAQGQKLKDLAPGANLSEDMNKYIGTLGTLATKLPPQAQKLVSDLATTFSKDFNQIVTSSIKAAGKEYGITDTDQLSLLIRDSISTINTPDNRRNARAATGGFIQGPGTKNSDSIPARLSNGEYVVRASAVDQYGVGMLNEINEKKFGAAGGMKKYATGGFVGASAASTQTATALGYGAVTASAVKKGISKLIEDAIANEEPENNDGQANSSTVANYKLLGAVAKILLGGAGVTARGSYASGNPHSARYSGRAIDYGVRSGTSVYAMAGGTATTRNLGASSFGKYVSIKHADGTESIYAHLSGFEIGNQKVSAGQRIGYSGNTGNSTGDHLHFEWSGLNPGSNPPGMREGGFTMSSGLANLHKNEAVLTAPLTQDLKDGVRAMKYNVPKNNQGTIDASTVSNNSVYNISVNASGTNDPRAVAREVVKAINGQDKRRNFGRSI